MSFVKKAVKAVFKGVKKIVSGAVDLVKRVVKSDWFKVAVIIAASVFTAGLASGGFAAFNAAMASATASGASTIGAFFSAVGSTMATGWSAITGSIFGAGGASASASGGASGGLLSEVTVGAATKAGGSVAAGTIAGMSDAALSAAHVAAGGSVASGATAASAGILSKFGKLLLDPGIGGTMLRGGIMMGIQGYAQAKQYEREDAYRRNRTVWGGPAFGGNETGLGLLQPRTGSSSAQQIAYESVNQQAPPAGPQNLGLLGMGPPPAQAPQPRATQIQQAFAQQPQPNQPPPATQPVQGRPIGGVELNLLGIENYG